VEHAILHLIYARFFCKFFRDFGLTTISEPFPRLLAQGMVIKDGAKMSKSKGNVVDPDDIVDKYGADTLRLFILFASPPDKEFVWNDESIEGCFRFLNRIWSIVTDNLDLFQGKLDLEKQVEEKEQHHRLRIKMHRAIKKVSEDIEERFHLNTAISSIMELYNEIKRDQEELRKTGKGKNLLREALESLMILLSPFAPHVCEELWCKTGHKTFLVNAAWPSFDPKIATEGKVTIVVQINGKLRDKFEMERDLPEDVVRDKALSLRRIQKIIGGKEVKKTIYVQNKLVNLVV
jgi:leucyl-tRNA synthetase